MTTMKHMLCLTGFAVFCMSILTGCGGNNSTSGNNTQATDTTTNGASGTDTTADGVGGVAEDVATEIGDMVDNVMTGFDNYADASAHFLERMSGHNTNAKYELRNENKDLVAYDGDTEGYYFELYDTATDTNGTKVGEYYMDPATGKVYEKGKDGKLVEFQFNNTGDSNNSTNNSNDKTSNR